MPGLIGYGGYVPAWRLARKEIGAFLGARAGRGERSAAAWDEDTTTMGVAAARIALASQTETATGPLFFATTAPAYLAKSNATAVHAALDLDPGAGAFDLGGGLRAGIGALLAAHRSGGIAVLADQRGGPAGSADEALGGDAAAALVFGGLRPVAELAGVGHATREYLERWQVPGEGRVRNADARFVDHVQAGLIDGAVTAALKDADVPATDIAHVAVAAASSKAKAAVAKAVGRPPTDLADDLASPVGFAGTAHWALLLAGLLDRADPGDHLAVVAVGEGVSVVVFEATSALPAYRSDRKAPALADLLAESTPLPYGRYLAWRGTLAVDEPVRAAPQPFSLVAAERNARWKYGLVDENGQRLADEQATVVELAVDYAADSPALPATLAAVEFRSGRRLTVELADAADVRVGDQVEMVFRRIRTTEGVHDYFWKARPIRR